MKGFGIYVKNDLLEPKHFEAIGQALWLYLWLLDKMTSISEQGVGKVLGGTPIKFEKIQKDLPMSANSFTRYVAALEQASYITALRTPYGHVFTITKAKKIFNSKENRNICDSPKERIAIVVTENRNCGENKEDNTIDNTSTLSEQSSEGLKTNIKDMPWNSKSDDFDEGIVDYDSGELTEIKKPQTKKYPNAPVVIKLFQEVLGVNQTFWKKSPAILESCERLYTERGVEKIKNALEFYQDHQEDKFCPKIVSPKALEEKYVALSHYKNSL